VLIRSVHPVSRLRAALLCRFHDPFHLALGTAGTISTGTPGQSSRMLHHRLGGDQSPTEDSYRIVEQGAVGRMMDIGLDHRPVNPQLATVGDFERPGEGDHMVEQVIQSYRLPGLTSPH
jgi:hypothetical protein